MIDDSDLSQDLVYKKILRQGYNHDVVKNGGGSAEWHISSGKYTGYTPNKIEKDLSGRFKHFKDILEQGIGGSTGDSYGWKQVAIRTTETVVPNQTKKEIDQYNQMMKEIREDPMLQAAWDKFMAYYKLRKQEGQD